MIGKKRQRKVTSDLFDLSLLFGKTTTSPNKRQKVQTEAAENAEDENHCPYLGQIRRHMLDFDFHKQCSVSLSKLNVYCCLVTGRYFQGKGQGTHAYMHSL